MDERLKELLNQVAQETEYTSSFDKDDMTSSYRISPAYMVETTGIMETARFLMKEKGKSLDFVMEWIGKAIDKNNQRGPLDWRLHVNPPEQTQTHIEYNITIDNSITINHAPPEAAKNEDPYRFTGGDFLRLMPRLEAHELFAPALAMENEALKAKAKGPIDSKVVALIALLWRKNILQNKDDLGAIPYDAAERFVQRDKSYLQKVPSNLQIGAALRVLETIDFLKQVRKANHQTKTCNAYCLLNQEKWFPDPKQ